MAKLFVLLAIALLAIMVVHSESQGDRTPQHAHGDAAYQLTQSGPGSIRSYRHLIAPGQRADVLVQAGPAGTYSFEAKPYDQGHPSPVGPLARLVVSGTPVDMKLPRALPRPPLESIKESEITNRRTVTFSATAPEADAAGHWQEFQFFIDGKKFDPNRIDQRVKLGAVEEWTIVNTHEHDDHVFHIHTNPFQIVSVNGKALAVPEWRDTVIVERKGGQVVFQVCHNQYRSCRNDGIQHSCYTDQA